MITKNNCRELFIKLWSKQCYLVHMVKHYLKTTQQVLKIIFLRIHKEYW